MSVISSNTLFHFTKRKNLFGILENGFYPRYSIELYKLKGKSIKIAVPMVSFCDIPLSQIKNHVKAYGRYAIGMTKTWGEKHRLNPVLYHKKDSILSTNVMNLISNLSSTDLQGVNDLRDSKKYFLEVFRYFKPYDSILLRPFKKEIRKKFYDEREWRYVPNPQDYDSKNYVLSEDEYNNPNTRSDADLKLKNAKLRFDPKDIRYIIISRNSQIQITKMIQHLRDKAKKLKDDKHTLQILISKILTYEQIKEDF